METSEEPHWRQHEELRMYADEIIMNLEQMPDRDKKVMFIGTEALSTNDIIRHLINLTPRGVEFVMLHRRAQDTIKKEKERRAKRRRKLAILLAVSAALVAVAWWLLA